jgi:NADH-quinone oxidoreductase subunit M
VFLIMVLSSIGLPALNGFIGEILILQGVYVVSKLWAAFAAIGIVLGAAYMLWLYQRTMFGRIDNPKNESIRDLDARELATFAPLVALALWIGLYPAPFLRRLAPTVNQVAARVNVTYAPAAATAPPAAPTAAPPPFITPPCSETSSAPGSTQAAAAPGEPGFLTPPCSATAGAPPAAPARPPGNQ